MTKTYCDLCGNEVEKPIRIKIEIPVEKDWDAVWIPDDIHKGEQFDVCEDCKASLMQFFKTRGKE